LLDEYAAVVIKWGQIVDWSKAARALESKETNLVCSLASLLSLLSNQKHSATKKAYLHTQKFWPKAPYIFPREVLGLSPKLLQTQMSRCFLAHTIS
jgi:hypothetical protein